MVTISHRIIRAALYVEGAKGLMVEAVSSNPDVWPTQCYNGGKGDFQVGEWHTPIDAFYSVKSAIAYCRKEGLYNVSVNLDLTA